MSMKIGLRIFLVKFHNISEEQLLVQWYVSKLLQKNRGPLKMHKVQSCIEALKKSQHIETDDNWVLTLLLTDE